MNPELIEKYFNDECSEQELSLVLDWFQTDEGRAFLENDLRHQVWQEFGKDKEPLMPTERSKKLFNRIQKHKIKELPRKQWVFGRVAAILLFVVGVTSLLYWYGVIDRRPSVEQPPAFITYATAAGQQKALTLSDGTEIRLNENSSLTIPQNARSDKRIVSLKGEAYFYVKPHHQVPFIIRAGGAVIKDLDTKFNVKVDTSAGNVQVAVVEGKVILKKSGKANKTSAILAKNHFGALRLSDGQITIEKGDVRNYLSWKNNHLEFEGETLAQISRQLERLYDVQFQFRSDDLKQIRLTAHFERFKLQKVLNIIAHTLDIHYKLNEQQVIWEE